MSSVENCSICLVQVKRGITTQCCDNKFHKKCLEKWTSEYNSCPLCRKPIDESKPIKKCENVCIEDDEQFARELDEQFAREIYMPNNVVVFQFEGDLDALLTANINHIINSICPVCNHLLCVCNIQNN